MKRSLLLATALLFLTACATQPQLMRHGRTPVNVDGPANAWLPGSNEYGEVVMHYRGMVPPSQVKTIVSQGIAACPNLRTSLMQPGLRVARVYWYSESLQVESGEFAAVVPKEIAQQIAQEKSNAYLLVYAPGRCAGVVTVSGVL